MRKAFAVCLLIAMGALSAAAQNTTFYFPQIADGDQGGGILWKTTIYLTNPAAATAPPVSGSIEFRLPSNAPFNLSLVNESGQPAGAGNTVAFQIAGGQTRKYVSAGTAPLSVGYATVTANGVIAGTAVFSQLRSNGSVVSEASVGASLAVTRQAIVVDTTQGFDIGVAFANPGPNPLPTTLRLMNTSGVEVISTTQPSTTFHTAAFVSQLFPGQSMVGTMQIVNTAQPLAAVALRFAPSGAFTTLPPVTLASLLQPAMRWIEQRAALSPLAYIVRVLSGNPRSIG